MNRRGSSLLVEYLLEELNVVGPLPTFLDDCLRHCSQCVKIQPHSFFAEPAWMASFKYCNVCGHRVQVITFAKEAEKTQAAATPNR